MTDQKRLLEQAINKAGKAFDVLVKDVEKLADGMTPVMVDQAFAHLAKLLELSRQRAHFVQQTSGFSFDTAPVVAQTPIRQQPFIVPGVTPAVAPGERPKRPSPRADGLFNGVERLVGSGKPNHAEPPAEARVALADNTAETEELLDEE